MSTALDLITGAMRLIGALGDGEVPTASEANDGLNALNDMLESWSIDRLLVYQVVQENFTWAAGNASRTIGPTGNFVTSRPTRIERGTFFRDSNGLDLPLEILDQQAYDGIRLKSIATNYPMGIYYETSYPNGTLYLYYVPAGDLSLYLRSWKQLQSFSALTDTVSLPPGYKRAIRYNLAIELSGEFAMQVPPQVQGIAAVAAGKLKRMNAPAPVSQLEVGVINRHPFNIYTGY